MTDHFTTAYLSLTSNFTLSDLGLKFFKVTDLKDAERRIVDMRCKMVIRGIHSEPANGPLVAGDYGSSACPVEFNAKYKHFPH